METTFEFSGVKNGKRIYGDGLYITNSGDKEKYYLAVDGNFIEVEAGVAQKTQKETRSISW